MTTSSSQPPPDEIRESVTAEPPDSEETSAGGRGRGTSAHVWVTSTYFAEGFPYTVVNGLAEIMFKEFGASLQVIGLTSVFHLPWNLKFLWGHLLDGYGTKRRWLVWTEILLSIMLVVLAATAQTSHVLVLAAAAFLVIAVLSATHDIAIDAYYLEGLDRRGQSKFVGYRAMAWRVAALVVSGPLLVAIGWWGWSVGLMICAGLMTGLTLLHALTLPRIETPKRSFRELGRVLLQRRVLLVAAGLAGLIGLERQTALMAGVWSALDVAWALGRLGIGGWIGVLLVAALVALLVMRKRILAKVSAGTSDLSGAFLSFLEQAHVGRVLAFVILFRTGESFLLKMRWPFLRDELGMALDTYGLVNGTVGVAASFTATLVGGWLIARHGLRRWLWPFLLAQNSLNLLYYVLAEAGAGVADELIAAVIVGEHFGAGLGTAVFMVYIMRCCHPDHKAAHMAIVTALMSVGFSVAGVLSGFLAEGLGFSWYFVLTFVASVPAMLLVFGVPHLDEPVEVET